MPLPKLLEQQHILEPAQPRTALLDALAVLIQRVHKHRSEDRDFHPRERRARVHAQPEVLGLEALDLAIVARPPGQHRAPQDGAAVERGVEQRGLVHEAREVDGPNGVDGLDADEGVGAGDEPGARGAGGEVELLEEAEGLVADGGEAVFVREADHGGGVVEGQGCVPRRQVEPVDVSGVGPLSAPCSFSFF